MATETSSCIGSIVRARILAPHPQMVVQMYLERAHIFIFLFLCNLIFCLHYEGDYL